MPTDQKHHWNKLHREGAADHRLAYLEVTRFAQEVQSLIQPKSTLLEIGCGVGNDARYFAAKGHRVLATDFSEAAIEKNKAHISRTTPNNSEQLRTTPNNSDLKYWTLASQLVLQTVSLR